MVYPDGSLLLTAGQPADSSMSSGLFSSANTNNPGMNAPKPSALYDTATGHAIAFSGLACSHAMMPSWSPDGSRVVFDDVDNHAGHALVVRQRRARSGLP